MEMLHMVVQAASLFHFVWTVLDLMWAVWHKWFNSDIHLSSEHAVVQIIVRHNNALMVIYTMSTAL